MANALTRWVALWDRRETPQILACMRMAIAIVVLSDLATMASNGGLWRLLWVETGTDAGLVGAAPQHTLLLADALYGVCVLSMLAFGIGLAPRWAGFLFVLAYAQTDLANPYADRGIDGLIRIAVLILACSRCGDTWSVACKLATGKWQAPGVLVPAWPRYLIMVQMVVAYGCAGLGKVGSAWWPWGEYTALYTVLRHPVYAAHDFSIVETEPFFTLTQLCTATTVMWEITFPVVLLAMFYERTKNQPGRLRRLLGNLPVRNSYLALGVVLHLSLAVTLRLGIFPFAMLALYPAFFHPRELGRRSESTAT